MDAHTRAALVARVEEWLPTHEAAFQGLGTACIDWLQAHITAITPECTDDERVVLAITLLHTLARSFQETFETGSDPYADD